MAITVKESKFKTLMLDNGWTVDDLANDIGLSYITVYKMTNGANVSVRTANKVAAAFGLKASELFEVE